MQFFSASLHKSQTLGSMQPQKALSLLHQNLMWESAYIALDPIHPYITEINISWHLICIRHLRCVPVSLHWLKNLTSTSSFSHQIRSILTMTCPADNPMFLNSPAHLGSECWKSQFSGVQGSGNTWLPGKTLIITLLLVTRSKHWHLVDQRPPRRSWRVWCHQTVL